jgi:ATP-dependent DNA helicase RecQ
VRQKFGVTHLVGILRGSASQRIKNWKHDQLSTYGQGNALTRTAWGDLTTQFFSLGLVTTDDVGAVKLTKRGQAVLDGEQVYGYFKSKGHAAHAADAKLEEGDRTLFEKLRVLRRKLADERGVPSFFIFSDRSLRDMTVRLPQTVREFRQVHGVGEHKCGEFGEAFLEIIREHGGAPAEATTPLLHANKRTTGKTAAQERREIAITGLQAGKSLDEISDECGVQPVTILRYVYDSYKKEGELPPDVLVPRSQVSSEIRDQVFALYASKGTDSLGPIYWELNESVEYIDLDLLRIEYLQTRVEQ